MMFLLLILLLCLVIPTAASAQESRAAVEADEHIINLLGDGWQLEGRSLSFDEQHLYLSLKKASKPDYDLYVCHWNGRRWGAPRQLETLTTEHDECSPCLSPDGRTLYFVRHEVLNPGTRKETKQSMLYFSERPAGGDWPEAQWMLLSNGADSDPRMLDDNCTFLFSSRGREEDEGRNPVAHRYYVRKLDKYNWTLPALVPDSLAEDDLQQPVQVFSGTVADALALRPMAATVQVFDVLTRKCLQQTEAKADGVFRVVLPAQGQYAVEVSQQGYTKVYLSPGGQSESVEVSLSPELLIGLNTYDYETMDRIAAQLQVTDSETKAEANLRMEQDPGLGSWSLRLPIGHCYSLRLSRACYADTLFSFDTRKDVLLPAADLDIMMHIGHVQASYQLIDAETREPISSEHQVLLRELREGEEATAFLAPMSLRCGARYQLEAQAQGYLFFDTVCAMPSTEQPLLLQLPLRPLREETTVQLHAIQFEFNSYVLKEESFDQLSQVADLLRRNPSLRIEVSAHTDDVGAADYNQRLSERRGEAVLRYLVDVEGVSPERMTAKGYGKQRPLVPNDSEENRAINRRVEFTVVAYE